MYFVICNNVEGFTGPFDKRRDAKAFAVKIAARKKEAAHVLKAVALSPRPMLN